MRPRWLPSKSEHTNERLCRTSLKSGQALQCCSMVNSCMMFALWITAQQRVWVIDAAEVGADGHVLHRAVVPGCVFGFVPRALHLCPRDRTRRRGQVDVHVCAAELCDCHIRLAHRPGFQAVLALYGLDRLQVFVNVPAQET